MKTFTLKNFRLFLVGFLTLTAISFPTSVAALLLRGGGDSFAEPLLQRYSQEYEQQTGQQFKYSTLGSAGGIRLLASQSVDFAGTSLIPTPIERNQIEDGLLMVPIGGGSLSIVYNLKNITRDLTTDVKLSREKLVQIFTGEVSNWKQINPNFPNQKIEVIVCSGSCATSFILTKYLNQISGGKIPASREPNWGFRFFSSQLEGGGIAGEVRRIDGAIGYVPTRLAREQELSIASLENGEGRYVKPTLEETQKALLNVEFNDDFTTDDVKDPKEGYPLVSLTWLLIYKRYVNEDQLIATKNLLTWILTEGQELNEQLEYTRIPEDVTIEILEAVNNELRMRPY
ncbi:MAG: substrate-binding domain-containing protein [Limnoraphis robusta]|jgi:phosphate transport system substrate-binding protein